MSYAQNLSIYFALLFGIIIVPGMDMFFVMANALVGGRLRAMMATAGIMLGGVSHTMLAVFCLGIVTRIAPSALTVILLAGAAYMAWIGYTLIRSSIAVNDIGTVDTKTMWAAFRQGFITCMLNPKAYVFSFAVIPQFIRSEYGPLWSQALIMSLLTVMTQFSIYGGLALVAATSRDLLIRNPTVTIWIGRLAGVIFMIVAILTVWQAYHS